jgi:hypothetical protein
MSVIAPPYIENLEQRYALPNPPVKIIEIPCKRRNKSYIMTLIEQIQSEIESLPQEDFRRLRIWFAEKDCLLWDKQLEADVADGKLDFLLEEAMAAKSQGTLQDL